MHHVAPSSRTRRSRVDNYSRFRSTSTPTRWHPHSAKFGRSISLPSSLQPHFDSANNVTSGFLSTIPEDTSSVQHTINLIGHHHRNEDDLDNVFYDRDIPNKQNHFPLRRHSENDIVRSPKPQDNTKSVVKDRIRRFWSVDTNQRRTSNVDNGLFYVSDSRIESHIFPSAENNLPASSRAGSLTTRGRQERTPTVTPYRTESTNGEPLREDALSVSSEGYSSSANYDKEKGHVSHGRGKLQRSVSVDTWSDNESNSGMNYFQRDADQSRSPNNTLVTHTQGPAIYVQSPSDENISQKDTQKGFGKLSPRINGSKGRRESEEKKVDGRQPQGNARSSEVPGSNPKSLQLTVPGSGITNSGNTSDRSGQGSSVVFSRQSAHTRTSDRGSTSHAGSKRQSIFDTGGSAVSAEMISNNPSAAGQLAFASLELPPGLFANTSSKQLRQLCKPLMTCFLLMMLAACLSVAVYFAIVLNKTQANHIEYLRARLNFFLSTTSSISLTSLSTSERTLFEEKYCEEISSYIERSVHYESYQGCEIASLQRGKLSVLLYFDKSSSNSTSDINITETSILQALESSASISANNILSQLSIADISVEETTDRPKFTVTPDDQSPHRHHPTPLNVVVTTGSETTNHESTTTPPSNNSTSSEEGKSFHPCAPGESRTYYRYPGSCSVFFLCLNGRSVALSCGHDLVFDLDRKVCVADVTDCDVDEEEASFFADVAEEDQEPCEYKGGEFHPHPRVCNLYFQCSSTGTSAIGVCPPGLVFDANLNTCARLDDNSVCPDVRANQDQ